VPNISLLVPLVVSVLSANSSTPDQAAGLWNSTQLPENISTSILSTEPPMTVTRVTVNSSLSPLPTITSLTPVLTTTILPTVDIILTTTTLDPSVKIVPGTYSSTMTPGFHSSELDQPSVMQDESAQLKSKSLDNQLWSDHDFVTLLDAALASFAAIQPAWIPIVVTFLTGKCFISVTMHLYSRI
jgi:hypothetical protein